MTTTYAFVSAKAVFKGVEVASAASAATSVPSVPFVFPYRTGLIEKVSDVTPITVTVTYTKTVDAGDPTTHTADVAVTLTSGSASSVAVKDGDGTTVLTLPSVSVTVGNGATAESVYKVGWMDVNVIRGHYTTSSTSPEAVHYLKIQTPDDRKILDVLGLYTDGDATYLWKFDKSKQRVVLNTDNTTKLGSATAIDYRATVIFV